MSIFNDCIDNFLPTALVGMVVTALDVTSVAVAVISLADDDSLIKSKEIYFI
jgi:hypothetical protein